MAGYVYFGVGIHVIGLWLLVFGGRSLGGEEGLWELVFGLWWKVFGLSKKVFGPWKKVFGFWSLVFGGRSLGAGLWSLVMIWKKNSKS